MFTRTLAVFAAAATAAAAAPVPPAPPATSLAAIPAQAPIVVQVRGAERVKDRLTALIKAAVPDFGAFAAAQIDEKFKTALEGRKLQGIAKDGPLFLAF